MLETLEVKGFSILDAQSVNFSPGLNVIIGENGTGKSHLLKLAYVATKALFPDKVGGPAATSGKEELQRAIADKLVSVFHPDVLGRLCTRGVGRTRAEITVHFSEANRPLAFSFSTGSKANVAIESLPTHLPAGPTGGPIFLPTREVMTLHPQLIEIYENNYLGLDETYYDLSRALLGGVKRGIKAKGIAELSEPLQDIMGGRLVVEPSGRFYLLSDSGGKFEMPLVAEGIRKIAMLTHLVLNGALRRHGTIYWDEPETNENPRLVAKLAQTLMALAAGGVQVFIATHSLFLMREIEYLNQVRRRNVPVRYFSLSREDDGIRLDHADALDDLRTIASLEAEIDQDDRTERVYWEGRE